MYMSTGSGKVVGLIHATWCGHCQTLMPIWEEVKKKLPTINFKDTESKNVTIDIPEINHLIKTGGPLQAEGYPTIYKIVDGKLSYFEKERTEDNIINWINETSGGKKIRKSRKSRSSKSRKSRKSRKSKK